MAITDDILKWYTDEYLTLSEADKTNVGPELQTVASCANKLNFIAAKKAAQ